ncbi:MAG: ATP phosphoribosyltransferase regulatory subunit, partial [Lachnospiraceae bacterium]|nr:ATP phosphoribosyltransferase regulatory subunit [Lachnospiraceae bacterium]
FGYKEIETPSFEYFDVYAQDMDMAPSREIYKFFDNENMTLALRPDFTPGVCRTVSNYFMDSPRPIRLTYSGQTFSNRSDLQGKLKEVTEVGAECIGEPGAEADAEIIGLSNEVLLSSGLSDFQITVGNVGFFQGIVEAAEISEEEKTILNENIRRKNYFGLLDTIEDLNISQEEKKALSSFSDFVGGFEVLEEAQKVLSELPNNEKSLGAINRLKEVYELLSFYGAEDAVTFDLGMLSRRNYYTGLIFRAYAFGSGEAILTGGRYDGLLKLFGQDAAAVGFTVVLDRLLSTLHAQHVPIETKAQLTLIIYDGSPEEYKIALKTALRLRREGRRTEILRAKDGTKDYFREKYGLNAEIMRIGN